MSSFTVSGFSDEINSDIIEQFTHLNTIGINYFEPRGINGKNISELDEQETEELKGNMEKYGIKASSIGSPIGKISINDNFEGHLKLLEKIIKIAKTIEVDKIRVFSFFIPEGENAEKYRDEVIFRMKKMTELAEKNDIILLHENEKNIYGDTAQRCYDILRTVNSKHLQAVFDPANFVQCKQDTIAAYKLLKPYVAYMHIKDSREDSTIVPAGYGIGNIYEILSDLYNSGYEGFVSLEPHLGSFVGLDALELDDAMTKLEASTCDSFDTAYRALVKIIDKIIK